MPVSHHPLGVFVLGMHRSGTSVVARLLNMLGFSLGPEEGLLRGESNPTGFWENASLIRLNRELLRLLGGYWTAPPELEPGWELRPELDVLRPEAEELAELLFDRGQWACKEPRACLTFPFWRRLIAEQPLVLVLVYRSPLEVAASLAARDGLSPAVGLALWERYSRSALECARGYPAYITCYDDVLFDPVGWCEGVARFLGLHGGDPVLPAESELTSFVRSDLRRSDVAAAALAGDELVSREQSVLLAAFERLRGAHESFSPPALPPETRWAAPLIEERRKGLVWEQTAKRQAAVIARVQSRRAFRTVLRLRAFGRVVTAAVHR